MDKKLEVYIHGEGLPTSKLVEVPSDAKLADVVRGLKEEGLGVATEARLYLEDDDDGTLEDQAQTLQQCGVGRRAHVHCHRCRKVMVQVTYNGETKDRRFRPSATSKRIRRWAVRAFGLTGPDAADKLLWLENKAEFLPDDHIGSHVSYPDCEIMLFLGSRVEILG